MILLVIAAGQPMCITSATRILLPNELVLLSCQVNINGTTNFNAFLTQGSQILATGNSNTVNWIGFALNCITVNVMCVAPAGISSTQCPTIQGMTSFLRCSSMDSTNTHHIMYYSLLFTILIAFLLPFMCQCLPLVAEIRRRSLIFIQSCFWNDSS